MIVIEGSTGGGQALVIVGLDFENLDRLRAGKPASSDVTGTLVMVHAAPTLHDVVQELVDHDVLPAVALEQFTEPARGEVHVWDGDDPGRVRVEQGEPHPEHDPAEHRRLLQGRVARAEQALAAAQADLAAFA